jgi:hypothetical protein
MAINSYTAPSTGPLDKISQLVGIIQESKKLYDDVKSTVDKGKQGDADSQESRQAREGYAEAVGSPIAESVSSRQLQEKYGPLASLAAERRKHGFEKELVGLKGAEERKNQLAKGNSPAELKATQYKAATYAKRAEMAEGVLADLNSNGFDPTTLTSSAQGLGITPEIMKSGDYKRFDQAKRNFVSAVLRPESGASISKEEYENEEKKYFAQAGDSPEVLEQKAAARAQAIEGLKAEAGAAYASVPTVKVPVFAGAKKEKGLVNEALADNPDQVRVVNGRVYRKTSGGWQGM